MRTPSIRRERTLAELAARKIRPRLHRAARPLRRRRQPAGRARAARHSVHRQRRDGLRDRHGQDHDQDASGCRTACRRRAMRRCDADADLAQRCVADLGLPLIVKPPHEGSTIGITKVAPADELQAALRPGRRASTTSCWPRNSSPAANSRCRCWARARCARALPIVEIVAPQGNYDYQNKYFTRRHPVPLPGAAGRGADRARSSAWRWRPTARSAARAGAASTSAARRATTRPFLLEVNTSPGMTGHSLVPMAARAVGIELRRPVRRILRSAAPETAPAGRLTQRKATTYACGMTSER